MRQKQSINVTGNTPPPPNLLPSPNWSIPNNINFVHSCPLHSLPQSLPCCAAQKIVFIAVLHKTYHGLHWCCWLPVYPCAQCSGCVCTQKHKPTAGGDNTWQTWRQIVMVDILQFQCFLSYFKTCHQHHTMDKSSFSSPQSWFVAHVLE